MPERLRAGAVAKKVRFYAKAANVDGDFAGHSLRRGFITDAAHSGATVDEIQQVSGHRGKITVLGYIEKEQAQKNPVLLRIFA